MSRPVETVFRAERVVTEPIEPPRFQAAAGSDWVEIRGRLSAGRSGWQLRANAALHREAITVTVTARGSDTSAPDIEEFAYCVRLTGLPPGSYWLQVSHAFWGSGAAYQVTEALFEARAWLPAEEGSVIVPPQRERPRHEVPVGRLHRRPKRVPPT